MVRCISTVFIALALNGLAPHNWLQAATIQVNQDDCTQPDVYCDIQSAIDAALDGDTVLLQAGDYDLWQESLTISKSLTLKGAGAENTRLLGDGKAPSALLSVAKGVAAVTLQGLTLRDRIVAGTAAMGAAALEHEGEDLSLIDMAFTNNRGGWGGAVRVRTLFGVIQIENCVFEENSGFAGGAFAAYDGSAVEINIKDSVFKNNKAVFSGGALLMRDAAEVRFENVVIMDNSAGNTGGGAHFFTQTGSSEIAIINSKISANEASKTGGVSTRGSEVSVTIEGSTVSNNRSFDQPEMADCGGLGFDLLSDNTIGQEGSCSH